MDDEIRMISGDLNDTAKKAKNPGERPELTVIGQYLALPTEFLRNPTIKRGAVTVTIVTLAL